MMMRVCGQCCILGPILQYQGADGCNCHMAVFMVRSLHQYITSAVQKNLTDYCSSLPRLLVQLIRWHHL